MSELDIPENVIHLIFEKIDSVEQLEVLLLLRAAAPDSRTVQQISSELRSSVTSVNNRLTSLEKGGLVSAGDNKESYRFHPSSSELELAVDSLAEVYRVRRQKIFELIFSPLKKGRQFADAFMVTKKGDKNG